MHQKLNYYQHTGNMTYFFFQNKDSVCSSISTCGIHTSIFLLGVGLVFLRLPHLSFKSLNIFCFLVTNYAIACFFCPTPQGNHTQSSSYNLKGSYPFSSQGTFARHMQRGNQQVYVAGEDKWIELSARQHIYLRKDSRWGNFSIFHVLHKAVCSLCLYAGKIVSQASFGFARLAT